MNGNRLVTASVPTGMDAFPFCKVTHRVMRSRFGPHFTEKKGYPTDPKTIGEMIRKRRLDLGLRQIDAAKMIGCDEMSIVNWEKGHRSPRVNHMAGVVAFLGFSPFQNGDTLAHQLVNNRKALGKSQKEFAHQIGVHPSTLARWERGERKPAGRFERIVAGALSELTVQTTALAQKPAKRHVLAPRNGIPAVV